MSLRFNFGLPCSARSGANAVVPVKNKRQHKKGNLRWLQPNYISFLMYQISRLLELTADRGLQVVHFPGTVKFHIQGLLLLFASFSLERDAQQHFDYLRR